MTDVITEVPAEDGLFLKVPEEIYHSDTASLSSSGARTLLESPARFAYERTNRKYATHFDLGHYVHGLVLGVGEPVVIIYADDYKTKAARDERDAAYAKGHVPILAKTAVVGQAMAKRVREHETAAALLENPEKAVELSAYWLDAESGVRLRARFDLTAPVGDWFVIGDVKTTGVSANPNSWGTIAARHGLFIQDAFYRTAAEATGLGTPIDFVFINVETEPPHLVSMTRLRPRAVELGRTKMRQAINLFAQCTANNHWPAFGAGIHDVDLPGWAYYQEEE
jgi:hypothetical protein